MQNREIADIFERMADILEIKGDNVFRISSYRKAARIIYDLTEDVAVLVAEGRLDKVPGIGNAMMGNIVQYLEQGKISKYEELKKTIPEGVVKMLYIPGMGPKTVALIYQKLGISNITELGKAVRCGKLRDLSGMGVKKEQNILRGIKLIEESKGRILLGLALPVAGEIVDYFKSKGVAMVSAAGSLRRMNETIGDIDILVGAKKGKQIIEEFVNSSRVKEVLACGDTKGSVITYDGFQVDIRVVKPDCFGSALSYFTGSKAHNVHLRELAKVKGFKINEYGIFKGKKRIGVAKEKDIYKTLKLDWIPPVLREDRGEIDAAAEHKLPCLVFKEDIKGDYHVHSDWSDGVVSIEEMAGAAKKLGYEYIVISDHSQSLKIAGGLSPRELEMQIDKIHELNKKLKGFTILCGAEVDIKNDGTLDFPDKLLKKLDIVTGAVHSGFKQDRVTLTKRITTAMKNPYLNIVAHPTGRIIGLREAYEIDIEEVLKAAQDTNTALEINAHCDRLDLNDIYVRRAKEMGVKLVIGSDAHNIDQLWMLCLGVAVAQRGWLEKKDLLNTLSISKLKKMLKK